MRLLNVLLCLALIGLLSGVASAFQMEPLSLIAIPFNLYAITALQRARRTLIAEAR